MTEDKASTLRLLREGIGNRVEILESRSTDAVHEVRARLFGRSPASQIPILFLLSSLAFLEAGPTEGEEPAEIDGWTPADFLSHLRFDGGRLELTLERIRGRAVCTWLTLTPEGELTLRTRGRGRSATRWLGFVRGRSHLQPVDA
jgi:hypothetical protein